MKVVVKLRSMIAPLFLPGGKICRPGHAPKWRSADCLAGIRPIL